MDTTTNRRGVAELLTGRLAVLNQSQRWLADKAGMSESSLSDILSEKQDITIVQAKRLGAVEELGISTQTILNLSANADASHDERLSLEMGMLGPLFQRLSPARQEQVRDYIAMLYNKEVSDENDDAGRDAASTASKKKPRK